MADVLTVELFRYKNSLFGSVIYMDESLRGKGELIKSCAGYIIKSNNRPALLNNILYIPGYNKLWDNQSFHCNYTSAEAASLAGEEFKALITALNSKQECVELAEIVRIM